MKRLIFLVVLFPAIALCGIAKPRTISDRMDSADKTAINYNFDSIYTYLLGEQKPRIKIGTFVASASTGNQSVTGLGFKPRLLFLFVTGGAGAISNAGSFGAGTTSSQIMFMSFYNDTSNRITGSPLVANKILDRINESDVSIQTATLTSLDSDGFTVNWSATQQYTIGYVAFE